jgi:hypothetical protein
MLCTHFCIKICVFCGMYLAKTIIIVSIISGSCLILVCLYTTKQVSCQLVVTLVETVNWLVCSADILCCSVLLLLIANVSSCTA